MVDLPPDDTVAEVVNSQSVPLPRPDDGVTRTKLLVVGGDGSSVYTVSGSHLFSSAPIARRRAAARRVCQQLSPLLAAPEPSADSGNAP